MKNVVNLTILIAIIASFIGLSSAEPFKPESGHFSNWDEVPSLIESITGSSYNEQLEKLYSLTTVKLGYPQVSRNLTDEEHANYMLQTQKRWQEWWELTGKSVAKEKTSNSQVDLMAFEMAWDFLGVSRSIPDEVLPVWIPKEWALNVTFSNGDYGGREDELWCITRDSHGARLTKLRCDFNGVKLSEYKHITPEKADLILKAICYVNAYAPISNKGIEEDEMKGLYYPHSTIRLSTNKQLLWNSEGYSFVKSRPEYRGGDPGRTYYFLRTIFSNEEKWEEITTPSSEILSPYRELLVSQKPYFFRGSIYIIQYFGKYGGLPELEAMLEWAEKEKLAVDSNMSWEVRSSDFSTGATENVRNRTRFDLEGTSEHIDRVILRIDKLIKEDEKVYSELYKERAAKLKKFVSEMSELEKKEEEEEIMSYPQPLRDLIIADRHDWEHFSAAISRIRENPDLRLFNQLATEIGDQKIKTETLLQYIFLENKILNIAPWKENKKIIAVSTCIDALSEVPEEGRGDLIETILKVIGGGKIEIENNGSSRKIEVLLTKNGSSVSYSGAENPLPVEEVERELHRLYKKSRTD